MRTPNKTLLALGACGVVACSSARTTPLTTASSQVVAAQGEIKTKRTSNENTELGVEVAHLAPPDKVASGATIYVVWTKPPGEDARPQNVGSMKVDSDLKGSLKTKTPLENFELLITPEANPNATEPTHEPVLKAKVAR